MCVVYRCAHDTYYTPIYSCAYITNSLGLMIVPGLINGNTFVFIQTNGHPLRYHVSESIKVVFDSVSKWICLYECKRVVWRIEHSYIWVSVFFFIVLLCFPILQIYHTLLWLGTDTFLLLFLFLLSIVRYIRDLDMNGYEYDFWQGRKWNHSVMGAITTCYSCVEVVMQLLCQSFFCKF